MDTAMEEKRGTYTALSLSLALHVILLLAAGALGLFSIAAPQDAGTPVEVTLYDAGPAAADAGDAAPAAAVSAVSDVVIADKTLPPETTQETPAQTNPTAALRTDGTAASGSSAPTGSSNGKGDAAGTTNGSAAGTAGGGETNGTSAPPAPPAERVAASLRAEAKPEYPPELIEDDIEGSVSVKILVAADGSVESVQLTSSSGYTAMDRAAIAAGYRFQFNPGDNGRRGVFPWTFHFRLT